jgi:hypothetical protein
MATREAARSLQRNWVLLVLGGLLVLVVAVIAVTDSLVGHPPASYQAGYDYGFTHAPRPQRVLAPTSKEAASTVTTVAVERCTTELQFVARTVSTAQQWKSGCEAGWIKKSSHATVGTEAMTTTST